MAHPILDKRVAGQGGGELVEASKKPMDIGRLGSSWSVADLEADWGASGEEGGRLEELEGGALRGQGMGVYMDGDTERECEGEEDSEFWDWEDVDGVEPAADEGAGEGKGDILIDLGAGEEEAAAAGTEKYRMSRAERVNLHRAHVLCLLARGLAFDEACSDTVLQASLASVLPDSAAGDDAACGSSAAEAAVRRLLSWFKDGFAVDSALPLKPFCADTSVFERRSSERVVERLLEVLNCRRGTAEELVALFIALLRSQGMQARSVRALDAFPLRSTAAQHSSSRGRVRPAPLGARASLMKKLKQVGKQPRPAGAPEPKRRAPRRAGAKAGSTAAGAGSLGNACDPGAVPAESGGAAAVKEEGSAGRRRRGDEEFEAQLQMALEATGAAQQAKAGSCKGDGVDAAEEKGGKGRGGWMRKLAGKHCAAAATQQAGVGWRRRNALELGGCHCWAEVHLSAQLQWSTAEPLEAWLGHPERVEEMDGRAFPLSYVVAFEAGGAKDVTRRYASAWLKTQRLRDERWWAETLAPLHQRMLSANRQPPAAGAGAEVQPSASAAAWPSAPPSRAEAGDVRRQDAQEEQLLRQLHQQQMDEVPSTLEGFRGHPKYVLQRHISKYKALLPSAKPLGLHRGEPYFLCSQLADLHTPARWVRHGRKVREAEMATPAKTVRKSSKREGWDAQVAQSQLSHPEIGASSSRGAEPPAGEEGTEVTRLYGEWQTEEWVVRAQNGKVPKNEYGNVECPPLAARLPEGTVHLPYERVAATARQLGVDFAPALVGFERQAGGRTVPRLEGIVVCEEHAESVESAHWQLEQARQEKAEAGMLQRATRAWLLLLRSLHTRLQLQATYGEPPVP